MIPDEIVEKAAQAILNRPPATVHGDYMSGRAKLDARAALEAIEPDLLSAARAEGMAQFYEAIAHGDDEHRGWLKEACENWAQGKPVPPPRGGPAIQDAANMAIVTHMRIGEQK